MVMLHASPHQLRACLHTSNNLQLTNVCFQGRKKLNIRCCPREVLFMIGIMSAEQHAEVSRYGFGPFLDMKIDALECRKLLAWIMDRTDPRTMTIYAGAGKELRITKDVIRLIMGLPYGSSPRPDFDYKAKVRAAENFRQSLGLTKDDFDPACLLSRIADGGTDDLTMQCFFVVLFNRLLFPQGSWKVTNRQLAMCLDIANMREVDWPQVLFDDTREAVRMWHEEKNKNGVTQTVRGCCIVPLVSPHYMLSYILRAFPAIISFITHPIK